MKASELTKANIGDTIVVRGEVRDVDCGSHPVSFAQNDGGSCWLSADTEVEIVERPFKVGDEVYCDSYRCFIRAIDGEEAWVRGVNIPSHRCIAKISALKRVAS